MRSLAPFYLLFFAMFPAFAYADLPITVPDDQQIVSQTNDKKFNKVEFARTVVAPSVRNIPSYSVYRHQYREYARENPLAHKALVFAMKGDMDSAERTLDVLQGRQSARDWARLTPDVSAKVDLFRFKAGIEKEGPSGSKASASFSTGASLSAKLDGEDIVVGYLDSRDEKEDRLHRLRVLATPEEIDEIAGVLATIDLNNQGAEKNGEDPYYSPDTTPLVDLRNRISEGVENVPVFLPDIEQQIETLDEDDAKKLGAHSILKRYLQLNDEEKGTFNNFETKPSQRLQIIGLTPDELSQLIKEAVWPAKEDIQANNVSQATVESILKDYVPKDEKKYEPIRKSIDDIDKRIARARGLLSGSVSEEQAKSLSADLIFLESEKLSLERDLRITKFEDSFSEFRGEVEGIAAVIGLVDAEFSEGIMKYVQGTGDVIMGAYRIYSGDVSFAAVGQMAQGIQTLTQRRGTSFEEIADRKLDAILENQKAIFEGLQNIDKRLGLISDQLDQLRRIVVQSDRIVQEDLRLIIEGVRRFERSFGIAAELGNKTALASLRRQIEDDYLEFSAAISDEWEVGRRNQFFQYYLTGQTGATPDLANVFNNARRALNTAIVDTSFNDPLVKREMVIDDIIGSESFVSTLKIPVSYRGGLHSTMLERLGYSSVPDMPNPEFLTQYSRAYLDLIKHMPNMRTPDTNYSRICQAGYALYQDLFSLADNRLGFSSAVASSVRSHRELALKTITVGYQDLFLFALVKSYENAFAGNPNPNTSRFLSDRRSLYQNSRELTDLGSPYPGYYQKDILQPSLEEVTDSFVARVSQESRDVVRARSVGINYFVIRLDLLRYMIREPEDLLSFSTDQEAHIRNKLDALDTDSLVNLLLRTRVLESRSITDDRLESLKQMMIFRDKSQSQAVRNNAKSRMHAANQREKANNNKVFNVYVSLSPALLEGGYTHDYDEVRKTIAQLAGAPVSSQIPTKPSGRSIDLYKAAIDGRVRYKTGTARSEFSYSLETVQLIPSAELDVLLQDAKNILIAQFWMDLKRAESPNFWRDLYFGGDLLRASVQQVYRDIFSLISFVELTLGDCAQSDPRLNDVLSKFTSIAEGSLADFEREFARSQAIVEPTNLVGRYALELDKIVELVDPVEMALAKTNSKACMTRTYRAGDLADRFEFLSLFRTDLVGTEICPIVELMEGALTSSIEAQSK